MKELNVRVSELLSTKAIDVFIGFGQGTGERVRAVFIRTPEQAEELIFTEKCNQNLAVYLLKDEAKRLGKIGFLASNFALRSMMQLASEFQIKDGQILALHITADNKIIEFADFKTIEDHLQTVETGVPVPEKEMIARLNAMSVQERYEFWSGEFSKCFKCYACRAACPMCYCHRCTTDCNQPQWIPVASHEMGNLDWHLMRAMHLGGRCVNCGECAKACPMGIPLNLLTYQLIDGMKADFGAVAGMKADAVYALSTYKPEDKENFIL
jgi:formate dehydrogenase (coenzyme F420) beta subunit